MDLSPQAKGILIFYDESAGELERYDSSVQALTQFTTCQITTDATSFFASSDVKKPFRRRYVSFQALLRQSERLKSAGSHLSKYLVFGQLSAQTRTTVPQHIWRHVELLTNHIDRVRDFLSKESTPRKSRNSSSEHSLMFYLTKSAQLQLPYQISQLMDCRIPISNICDEMSSSPKFTLERHLHLVADMQNFSKLYLLTKQLQIRSEISYILLVERGDPEEIMRRMQDHYKQEVKVYLGRWQLINCLCQLTNESGSLRTVKIEEISIVNVRAAIEDRWLSQHNVENLESRFLSNAYNLIFVKQSDVLAIFQQLSRMNLVGRTIFFTEDMIKSNTLQFQSSRDISIIISTDPELLNKLQYREYQSKNEKQIVRNLLQNTDQLSQLILDKIENTLYYDKELIKVFSLSQSFYNEVRKELINIIDPDRIIHYDLKIVKSFNQYVNSKDFLIFQNIPQLSQSNGRCLHVSDRINLSSRMLSLKKSDLPYYIKRQKELQKAYESYSSILEIQSLGIFFVGDAECLQRRLRESMSKAPIKLSVQTETYQTVLRNIRRTANDVNLVLADDRMLDKLLKECQDMQNVYIKSRQQHQLSTIEHLFSAEYQLLINLAQCLQQHRLKSSHKPDYINLRIFNFKNAQISEYLQKTLEKKQVFLYKRQDEFNDIFGQLDKNIKQVILMSLEGYTQEIQRKVEQLHRNKLITFEIILVTPKAYILKTFKRKGTGYEFLSEKELKSKIDQWKSLREEQERQLQVELLAKMKEEVKKREEEERESRRIQECRRIEQSLKKQQISTILGNGGQLSGLPVSQKDSLSYSLSKIEGQKSHFDRQQTINKINQLTVLTQSVEIQPSNQTSRHHDQNNQKSKEVKQRKEKQGACLQATQYSTQQTNKITNFSRSIQPLPIFPQNNQSSFTLSVSAPQNFESSEALSKPILPIPAHPHSANSLSKQKESDTRESSFRLQTEDLKEPISLSPIPIRQQNMNSVDQIFQDLTEGVSQIEQKKIEKKKSSRPEKAIRTVKLLKNGQPISREKTVSATSSQKNKMSKIKKTELESTKRIPDHFKPFVENKEVANEYYVSSNHAEERIKAEMLLSESKRSISSSLKRMNSGYAGQQITNYRILKSRDPSRKDNLSASSRSTDKKQIETQVEDPFEQFNQCQQKLKETLCHENTILLYIPVTEEQFTRNLKARLSVSPRVVIKPYFNYGEISEQAKEHTIIVSVDMRNYVEKDKITWIFVTKNQKKVATYGNAYHFPSMPYCEEFIVQLFRPKIEHVLSLTSSTSLKRQKKKVYVFFRLDCQELWEQAKKCEHLKDCKTKPYKPGCLGLTLTDVNQTAPVIILTTDDFYDEQAYVVYSLRKNIEIYSCKSSEISLVKKIQQILSENVEKPIEKVKPKKLNKILKQFKSCTLIQPNF